MIRKTTTGRSMMRPPRCLVSTAVEPIPAVLRNRQPSSKRSIRPSDANSLLMSDPYLRNSLRRRIVAAEIAGCPLVAQGNDGAAGTLQALNGYVGDGGVNHSGSGPGAFGKDTGSADGRRHGAVQRQGHCAARRLNHIPVRHVARFNAASHRYLGTVRHATFPKAFREPDIVERRDAKGRASDRATSMASPCCMLPITDVLLRRHARLPATVLTSRHDR